ncbi:hypothetical protein DPEC_G00298290 [Dallia pectoralis]|uniref:Uncharacterized protein n=1 Tax=Dallia pectoralis TaxID=75939 RepID=A0ACC2FFW7_DALPE|nr:hypothetical protein DPEC_G00298290 [Dallia pectoralis]
MIAGDEGVTRNPRIEECRERPRLKSHPNPRRLLLLSTGPRRSGCDKSTSAALREQFQMQPETMRAAWYLPRLPPNPLNQSRAHPKVHNSPGSLSGHSGYTNQRQPAHGTEMVAVGLEDGGASWFSATRRWRVSCRVRVALSCLALPGPALAPPVAPPAL